MKQSKITSYLPWESKHGVPSSVFRAIFMRVACPNELQYLVSKQNHRYARARTGHECVGERRVPLYFKRDRTKWLINRFLGNLGFENRNYEKFSLVWEFLISIKR